MTSRMTRWIDRMDRQNGEVGRQGGLDGVSGWYSLKVK